MKRYQWSQNVWKICYVHCKYEYLKWGLIKSTNHEQDAGNIANVIEEFNVKVTDVVDKDKQNPSYNVCPTRFAPTYRTNKDNQAIVQYMSWGLIPFWTKKKADAKYVIQFPFR